jgi:hypothetical protein
MKVATRNTATDAMAIDGFTSSTFRV